MTPFGWSTLPIWIDFDESLENPSWRRQIDNQPCGCPGVPAFHTGNGVYKSFKCTSGQDQYYKISVYSPTYGSVTAESTIPAFAELSNIQVEQSKEFRRCQWNFI